MRYVRERKQVLDTAVEIYQAKLVPGTWGNVSLKVEDEDLFLITPSGMDYSSMSVEDIVLVDFNGKVVEGQWKPSVETPLHSQVYSKRSDSRAVVHVHSPYATAFAVARQSIPVILEETAQVIGHDIPVAAYAHCGSDELADNVIKSLGSEKRAVLLANHGLLGLGPDLSTALRVCYIAEKTAMVAIKAKSLGEIHALSEEDIKLLNESFKSYGQAK